MRYAVVALAALASLTALPAAADIYVGRFGAVGDNNIVSVFADTADGDPSPIRRIGGNTTTLGSSNGFGYSPGTGELFVADFSGQAVRVFARLADGNIAPIRSITSTFMGQPRDAEVDPVHNELIVITQLRSVSTFPLNASGDTVPLRRFGFSASQLDNPAYLGYSPQRDEIFVTDFLQVGANVEDEVLVFPRTADFGATPIRFIRGANTMLSNQGAAALAINDVAGEIYVAVRRGTDGAILTFPIAANGDVAPIRRISGSSTTLSFEFGFFGAMTYNAANDTISLSTEVNGSSPGIVTFARLADGDVAPLRRIAGPNSGSLSSGGWYSMEAIDFDPMFRNGFE